MSQVRLKLRKLLYLSSFAITLNLWNAIEISYWIVYRQSCFKWNLFERVWWVRHRNWIFYICHCKRIFVVLTKKFSDATHCSCDVELVCTKITFHIKNVFYTFANRYFTIWLGDYLRRHHEIKSVSFFNGDLCFKSKGVCVYLAIYFGGRLS